MQIEQLKELIHEVITMDLCTGTITMAYGARPTSVVANASVEKLNTALALVKEEILA